MGRKMRQHAAPLILVCALLVGCSGDEGGKRGGGGSGNGGNSGSFQGNPALDGLKSGDCLKYPNLQACKELGIGG